MAPSKGFSHSTKSDKPRFRRQDGYKTVICTCPCGAEVAYSTHRRHKDAQAKQAVLKATRELQNRQSRQNLERAIGQVANEQPRRKRKHPETTLDSAKRAKTSSENISEANESADGNLLVETDGNFTGLPLIDSPPIDLPPIDSPPIDSPPIDSPGDADLALDIRRSARALHSEQIIRRRWKNISLLIRVGEAESDSEEESGSGEESGPEDDLNDAASDRSNPQEANPDDDFMEMEDDADTNGTTMADIFDWLDEGFMRELHGLDGKSLSESDLSLLRQYTFKVEDHLADRTFQRLARVFPHEYHNTLKVTKKRVETLSGLQPVQYSCCTNSCICYTGPFEDLDKCPKCGEARYKANGKPRKYFVYQPIIPRLLAMLSNPERATEMLYRSQADSNHKPGVIRDIFDSSHYRSLLGSIIPSEGGTSSYFFSDKRDVALGLSTDGFTPFKRRDKTCWPLVLFNYNLSPADRFKKINTLNLGVIPGPKKPWDIDSYLWPLIQELNELQTGVKAFDAISQSFFQLRGYLILAFGDIPAAALIMRMKGTNGVRPCRTCNIKGIRDESSHSRRPNTLYVPLRRDKFPNANPCQYDPSNLPIRTHEEFMRQAEEVQMAPTVTKHEGLSTEYGIKGIPILSLLPSISFPNSFPFDFMHLIFERLLPNLIAFWTGQFKGVDHRNKGYVFAKGVWDEIGAATAACNSTVPSAFGAMPNVSKKLVFMTAEMMMNWMTFVAPIVLQGRFPQDRYYFHFMRLVKLVKLCMGFEFDARIMDDIEGGFISWVKDYERLYYENSPARLAACPLALHALLHIAWGIRVAGPVWAYWAFPMERECGYLLRAIKSRRHPYVSITAHITATAHLNQIRLKYKLYDELALDPQVRQHLNRIIFEAYPDYILSAPKGPHVLPFDICNKVYAALATRFDVQKTLVKAHIKLDQPIEQYGRVICNKGDVMVARDLVNKSEDTRDSSFVKYTLLEDTHARYSNREAEFHPTVFFGQLKRVIALDLPAIPRLKLENPSKILFAVVETLNASKTNGIYFYKDSGPVEVVDLTTLQCVIGRVLDRKRWGIIDRSGATVLEIV